MQCDAVHEGIDVGSLARVIAVAKVIAAVTVVSVLSVLFACLSLRGKVGCPIRIVL